MMPLKKYLLALILMQSVGCGPIDNHATEISDDPPAPVVTPAATRPTLIVSPTASLVPTTLPQEIIGPDHYPARVNPLTGLVVEDPSALERRPLLIKISNAPPVVRPQSGMSFADLAFEHYAEGGQTRFSALFYSQGLNHVGSVRSTRLIDLQLAPAYDAILIFSGGSLGVIDSIRESKLFPYNIISPQFGYGPPYFVRFPREGLPLEHTLFTDTAELWQLTVERKVRQQPEFSTPGLSFSYGLPASGQEAASSRIDYARTTAEWRYDLLSGAYLRWSDGVPHLDAYTGNQLSFENIIVISAYHDEVDLFPEKYFGTEKSIYIELQGEGPVSLLRDGQLFQGRWRRENPTDQFTFYDAEGNALILKPGRTFFQVIRAGFEQLIVGP